LRESSSKTNAGLRLGFGALLVGAVALAAPSLADSGIQQRFDVAAGGTLSVNAEGASVKVLGRGSKGAEVSVKRGTDSRAEIEEDYTVSMTADGDDLVVRVESKREGWFNWRSRKGLEIEIEVPARYDAEVVTSGGSVTVPELDGRLDARSSGGSVRIGRVAGPTEVNTSGGSVTIEESRGEVLAKTSGGSIRITRAGGPVVAKTSGGSITVSEVAGALQASTSGGSIRATLTEQPAADCELSTSGGSVTVELAPGIAVDLDASAGGGSVRSEIAVDVETKSKSKLVGQVNGGGPKMTLNSSGGGVTIRTIG
jgi:hypothetical protein